MTETRDEYSNGRISWLFENPSRVVLNPSDWQRLVELLDRPPQDNPGLERLFARLAIFP